MTNKFWRGATHAIVQAMKATGNRPGVIAEWKSRVARWAEDHPHTADGAAVQSWLSAWQPRPFYTAAELAPLWPALAIAIGHTNHWPSVPKSPGRLAHELDFARLPYRMIRGKKYYLVERIHYWQKATQGELENELV